MRLRLVTAFLSTLLAVAMPQAASAAPSSVYIEELTWMEVRDRMRGGATTVIIPTGGTEQNGPQIVIGKHNIIVRYTAGEIAKRLGNTLVAPVIPYVPEGRIDPPEGHLQFPGTIGLSDETFAMVLEDAANSLRQQGFRVIAFIGDHGGNQPVQQRVAEKLTDLWFTQGVVVVHVGDYYSKNGQGKWSESMGLKSPDPLAHAGHIDTSEVLAIDPRGVRDNMRGARTDKDYKATGSKGDSSLASVDYGRRYLSLKIEAAVDQLQNATASAK